LELKNGKQSQVYR